MNPIWKFLLKNAPILVATGQLVIEVGRAIKHTVSPDPKTQKPSSKPKRR